MTNLARNITLMFAAGCLGGLVNSLAVWLSGMHGLTAACGVKLAPALTLPWLYPRIVWGGIWGLLFLLPFVKHNLLLRGLVISAGPTLVQLFYIFPYKAHKGMLGLELGTYTPLFVIAYNALWGITAAIWLYVIGRGK